MTQRLTEAYQQELDVVLRHPERLMAAYDAEFLAQDLQSQLDQIMELTKNLLGTPYAAVNLIYAHEQITLSKAGDLPRTEDYIAEYLPSTAVDETYCQHVVKSAGPLAIYDAVEHPLVSQSIWAKVVRAYLGVPLKIHDHVVGTICVTSFEPKTWNSGHVRLLAQCAALVQALIERGATDEQPEGADPPGQREQEETDSRPDR